MIKDALSDIFSPHSSFGERCLGAFILLIMLVLVGLMGLLAFVLIDSANITATKTATTVIESKETVPAHTTTTFIVTGKVTVPVSTYYPESYQLHFEIDGKKVESSVEKDFFDSLNTGDKIEVDYGFGRLSGSCQPVKIRLVGPE